MGSAFCPVCDSEIYRAVYEEWRESSRQGTFAEFKLECPHCKAKLAVTPDIDFWVDQDSEPAISDNSSIKEDK